MLHIAPPADGKTLLRHAFNHLIDYHVLLQEGSVKLSQDDLVNLNEVTERLASIVIPAIDDQILQELKEEEDAQECLKTCFAQPAS